MTIKEFIIKQISASRLSIAKKTELIASVQDKRISPSMEWIMKTARTRGKVKLLGEQVRFISDETANTEVPDCRGTLVKIVKIVEGLPLFRVNWSDDLVSDVWSFQVQFIDENIAVPPAVRKTMMVNKIIESITKGQESSVRAIKDQISDVNDSILDYMRSIKRFQAKKKDLVAMTKIKFIPATPEQITADLELIKRLETIEDAYVSKNGNIIIITKDLKIVYAHTDYNLGRFIIKLEYNPDGNYVLMENRDWGFDDFQYGHPHLDHHDTCWGSNKTEVFKMLNVGQIFQLVDFIIAFYKEYPQEHGSPHINYGRWLDEREARDEDSHELLEPKL